MTRPAATYHRFDAAGWRGLIAPSAGWLICGDPLRRLDACPGQIIKQTCGVLTRRVDAPAGAVFMRHMTQLKGRSDGKARVVDRVKWVLRPSRALRTLRVHRALTAAGVAVPTVLLAARRRRGLAVEDLLVTEAVPGDNFVQHYHAAVDPEHRGRLFDAAGRAVASLHRHRFVHGDMLPGNLLIRPDGSLVFVDNERTRRPAPGRFTDLRRLNVCQMVCRLIPLNRYAMIRRFLDGYYEVMGMDESQRRRDQAVVMRRARHRRARIDADQLRAGRRLRRLDRPAEA